VVVIFFGSFGKLLSAGTKKRSDRQGFRFGGGNIPGLLTNSSGHVPPDRLCGLCICAVLAVATVAVYWQVWGHEFVNYDDSFYVYKNPDIQSGVTWQSLKWAFTTDHAGNWHPVTWISHMLDWQLFGYGPAGHHLMNLFLHLANTLLLFAVLRRATGELWRSAFVAGLFALHPLHVESVAWVAERKDVLSTFFWMLTMAAYVWYAERPCIWRYLLVLVSLALGLMAKPMLVTLPFVLLLLDYWPLGRVKSARQPGKARAGLSPAMLIVEKIPLFAAITASSIVTFIVQQRAGAMEEGEHIDFIYRAANACTSYVGYVVKMVWPSGLAMFYPHPRQNTSILYAVVSALLVMSVTVVVIRFRRRKPYLPVGWLWYLGTLVPVIGLIQVGDQAMADRYTYVPLTGLFIIITWALPELLGRWRYVRYALWTCGFGALAALGVLTHYQQGYWKDTITLCEHALEVTKDNYVAHFCMTESLGAQGRLDDVIRHNLEAVRIMPDYLEAVNGLAVALDKVGRVDEAILYLRRALELNPELAQAHNNLGFALARKGEFAEAVGHYKLALKTHNQRLDLPIIHSNLAFALLRLGRYEQAAAEYGKVLQSRPSDPDTHNMLGAVLFKQGKIEQAIRHFSEAIKLDHDYVVAQDNLGVAFQSQGNLAEAIGHFRQALALRANATRHKNLAGALKQQGSLIEAADHYQKALLMEPADASAHISLGRIRAEQADFEGAVLHFSEAVRLEPNSALAQYNLGRALRDVGRDGEAIKHFSEAVRLKPDLVRPMNDLAWFLATHWQAELRDGDKAVEYAERACKLTDYKYADVVDTLAAAYAAAGRFPEAVTAAQKALRLVESDHADALGEKFRERLELYKSGRAYFEPSKHRMGD